MAGQIHFTDIAKNPDVGIEYARAPSASKRILDRFKSQGIVDFAALEVRSHMPGKPRGAPGVAIFDYDRDGDLDLYVTNGPGRSNSLYANQFIETGILRFSDMAGRSGTELVADDSTGVCFGDIDNDGDQDLLVLNLAGPNRLLENQGNGVFRDIGLSAGISGTKRHPSSCAMGDVNGDGLLDLVIGNTFDNWKHRLPLMTFDNDRLMEPDELYINKGNNHFSDASMSSGVSSPARITWAVALVDYDGDGDVDLITADDQGAKAPAKYGGVDHGYVRIYRNDGSGHFENVTEGLGTNRFGAWMGLAFGDFNHDRRLDIFATNAGYFFPSLLEPLLGFKEVLGEWASGWFLADPNGGFRFPGVGDLVGTPFGWGTSAVDYDNDGSTDIIYYGGVDMGAYVGASNPGTFLHNDGAGHFAYDADALAGSVNHIRRSVQGVATGDLNNDGFVDVVTVANQVWPEPLPLVPYLPLSRLAGTPFDATASIWPTFAPLDPFDFSKGFIATGMEPADGDLAVEISGGGDNRWVKVMPMGSVGLTDAGRVNRDGIGAIVRFRPAGGSPDTRAVLGGSSYASQDALQVLFGMGQAREGTLDVIWPGGNRNRLYHVRAGETVVFPEIPCGIDDQALSARRYRVCLVEALDELEDAGLLSREQAGRFLQSAVKARPVLQDGRHDTDIVGSIDRRSGDEMEYAE